jgi:CHRD domain
MRSADRTSGATTADAPKPRGSRSSSQRIGLRVGVAAVASGALAAGALALAISAGASVRSQSHQPAAYGFTTLDNNNDPTFNQLLGINDHGVIAGYLGSGAAGHPNQGYLLPPQYGQANYVSENYPGSVQTQVTGLNNHGVTVGFFSDQNNQNLMNDNFGFYDVAGHFHQANFPTHNNATPPIDQLLGINDLGVAVGFYTNGQGVNRGYEYNINTRRFSRVMIPGVPNLSKTVSLTATAISNADSVAGFYSVSGGTTDGFLETAGGHFTKLAFPGASMTQPFGVNDLGEVVGAYTVGTGSAATTHGFTWTSGHGFTTVDDPSGVGTTLVNGVNDRGDLIGFYTDTAGNTDGFLATPATRMVRQLDLKPMPAGTVTFGQDSAGHLTAQLNTSGLTPGSSHTVELWGPDGSSPLTQFSTLTASSVGTGDATLDSAYMGSIPDGSRLVILNGSQGGSVADEPIAETSRISGDVSGPLFTLHAVEVDPDGTSHGTPEGRATIVYDPSAQTLTVTVDASGLTPGAHAAHIHLGSCASQGPVQFMLMDLVANSRGKIVNETRVISDVTTPIPASGWYLNIHQGDSNTILQNGQPTISFRPLLCSDI